MKDTELKHMRDEALYAVYVKGLQDGAFESLNDAANYVIRQEAPQFYMSAHKMSSYIGMIESNKSLINFNSASRRRIWRLYDDLISWRRAFPGSPLARERILEILIAEPAPEFYIKPSAARQIIQRMRKEKQDILVSKL